MNNWKEKFKEQWFDRYDEGWTNDEIASYIETEIIEKLIEEIPDGYLRIEGRFTDTKFIKGQLRAKWLGETK